MGNLEEEASLSKALDQEDKSSAEVFPKREKRFFLLSQMPCTLA